MLQQAANTVAETYVTWTLAGSSQWYKGCNQHPNKQAWTVAELTSIFASLKLIVREFLVWVWKIKTKQAKNDESTSNWATRIHQQRHK
jgi:hypothetical protein